MKIVILDGYIKNPGDLSWSRYEELGDLTIYDRTQAEDTKLIIERIGDAEAVLVSSVPLNREVIEGISLYAISQRTGLTPYLSLPLHYCWRYATVLGTTMKL